MNMPKQHISEWEVWRTRRIQILDRASLNCTHCPTRSIGTLQHPTIYRYSVEKGASTSTNKIYYVQEDWDTVTPDELESLGAEALTQLLMRINPHPASDEPQRGYLEVILQ